MSIPNLTYKTNLLISAPKIDTDLLWDLSILFIGLTAVYLVGIFFYKNKISSTSKKVRDRKRELSPMISEFLFLEEDATKDEKSNYVALKVEIRELLKNDFNRKVLSEILLDLRKDISGDAQRTLFKLYQDLGLHKDAFSKLSSWRWQVISKGILELTQMEVAESYGFVTKFINDKRSTIRKQAEIATVTLRHEGISFFLDTTKYRISEWQQLKLLDVIRNKEDFQPPRFKAWLTSNNKYVVLFALRLIKYYNQNDANTSLIELVKHKNNQIKEEAIACIKEFNVIESLDTLKLVFWNCSIDVKIAILDTIAHIGSETDIEFLNLIDKKELNFSVKSKALSSINIISPESIMPSKGIQKESGYKIPNDITEAVAKIHAEKHAELTGEGEEQSSDEEIVEAETMAVEANMPVEIEETNNTHAIEEKNEKDTVGPSIRDTSLIKEIDITNESDTFKAIYEIEVIEEKLILEENIHQNDLETDDWEIGHLNFLPIVEEEVKTVEEQELDGLESETTFNINVDYEELISFVNTIDADEEAPKEKPSSFLEEFDMAELGFLPIVVDNVLEDENNQEDKLQIEKTELPDIMVEYEEEPYDLPINSDEDSSTRSEFDFKLSSELKNMDNQEETEKTTDVNYERYQTEGIRNTAVIYEEIPSKDPELRIVDIEVVQPFIFSTENEFEETLEGVFKKEEVNDDAVELPIENEQLLQKIIDDLISFDNTRQEENHQTDDSYINPDWDLDEDQLDFIPVSFEKDEELPENYIKIERSKINRDNDKIDIPKASIPKAIFGDIEFEASTRQLLNDLEEMGDQREIPFLKELLDHEKYDMFKERINYMIDMFNDSEEDQQLENPLHPFSVFQDLFRTCDDEAKLILLDEVVAVGDEKEIHFLEDLTKDDSPEIRRKALEVLKGLKTKLGLKEKNSNLEVSDETETSQSDQFFESIEESSPESYSDPNDIFDLNFDFGEDLNDDEDEKKKADEEQNAIHYDSFFGQICSFSHKIMEKLNG